MSETDIELPEELKALSEDEQKALVDIFKIYDKEDDEIHKARIRAGKKAVEFWHGVQYLFWSSRDETWRSPSQVGWQGDFEDEELEELGSFYDYVVNIFKGHGEALISALAAQIPALRFLPDDADKDLDLITAKTYDKVGDLIQRHNKSKIMALKAYFFLYLTGIVASYTYKDSDFKYGSYKIQSFDLEKRDVITSSCPECGFIFNSAPSQSEDGEVREENSESGDNSRGHNSDLQCPQCGEIVKPKEETEEEQIPVPKEPEVLPKTRVKVDLHGGLSVKVRYTAKSLDDSPYLIRYTDIGKELAIERFPHLEDYIDKEYVDNFDRMPRSQYTYPSDPEVEAKKLITIYSIWIRPVAFNLIGKDRIKIRKSLKEKFPNGLLFEVVGKGKKLGSVDDTNLIDNRWKIGQATLSEYIYSDPSCQPLISIQEMRNTLVNLVIETIEHGVPAVLADPKVVNFDTFGKFEAVPGYWYKALGSKPGQKISDSIYEGPRATLSKEVPLFQGMLDKDAQFTLGTFPSVLGQPSQRDRATAKEYLASRNFATQRLKISWELFKDWYCGTIENAVHLYVENIKEDERFVQKDPSTGGYVNVWIKLSELAGEVGGCEPEASESFPVTMEQKRATVMELMDLQNPYINTALYSPENSYQLQEILSMSELKLPGEAQRIKQLYEIRELIKDAPEFISMSMHEGVDQEAIYNSSVPIDPDLDDDPVHISVCKDLLVSEQGILMRKQNPGAYMNIFYHMKAHMKDLALKTAGANMTPPGVAPHTEQAPDEMSIKQ